MSKSDSQFTCDNETFAESPRISSPLNECKKKKKKQCTIPSPVTTRVE